MNLLIDIGNSRLKWATGTNRRLASGRPIANSQLDRQRLIEAWQTITTPNRIGIAQVGNPIALTTVQAAVTQLWPGVTLIQCQSQAQAFGVSSAYRHPEKLGVDRWLSLIAAHRRYRTNVLIADCGTAITLDLLTADGQHQGGLIAPGLTLMKQALAGNTQALPFSDERFPLQPAAETNAAIYSGALTAALALIERVMAQQPPSTRLVLSGGDAELIAEHLAVKAIIDNDLVLHGIAIAIDGATQH